MDIDIDTCLQLYAALMPAAAEGAAFPRPTPPPSESIAAAIRRLRAIGAIEDDGVALVVIECYMICGLTVVKWPWMD